MPLASFENKTIATADCPHLTLNNVSVRYGDHAPALENVSLSIQPGEKVAIIGPSGAGKTTLLRTLFEAAPEHCAFIAQDYELTPQLTVFNNIDAGQLDQRSRWRNIRNLVRAHPHDRQHVHDLATPLGIADLLNRRVGELSGGQQQRTAIARALNRQKPIIIGDEPVSAIDPRHADTVMGHLLKSCTTCVVAMHAIDTALESCSRAVALRSGRIVYDGPCATLTHSQLDDLFAP